MVSPRDRYQEELAEGLMLPDQAQAEVVEQLHSLYELLQQMRRQHQPPNQKPMAGAGSDFCANQKKSRQWLNR